ncbi:hypothetical protein M409DRAFT_50133 [Zasmidium cellare ATCC 36951]|uniref:RING-type domain-containing protein n=1 Tax=Zasmidium cellare ATCC 36951 TaxID=1080233 RepID=A0A6A6D0A0_ZASCE|nr:uncharacterized protein M409DRAFT_50133 [Zasmidium cellare ATCC 36951]KAF2172433.1 hypothetical protein M409DRAFT_50133 [Zasmidium cellare ATCC 36951]
MSHFFGFQTARREVSDAPPPTEPPPAPPPATTTTPAPAPALPPAQAPPSAPAPPVPRPCVLCGSTNKDDHLIRACRRCDANYCYQCLHEYFLNALDSPSLFPPRCCCLIQLYTLLPSFDADKAARYREMLEEWLCNEKTYCPVPTCSAFIPERLIPPSKQAAAPPQTPIHETISNLLRLLDSTPFARFFRGNLNMDTLPGFREAVANPISLADIKRKNDTRSYSSMSHLANDVVLLVENAKRYNGDGHPVTHAANGLFAFFIERISAGSGNGTSHKDAHSLVSPESRNFFPCPKCHVAICTGCKQVEHTGKPCDTSDRDSYELAMLEQFGYKQCPRCKQGVRRMYGCSHMQCTCGAHWCWRCTKSLDQCLGDCAEEGNGELDDEDEDDMAEDDDEGDGEEVEKDEDSGFVEGAQPTVHESASGATLQLPIQQRQDPPIVPTNLDAGGDARWEQSGEDFGEEPEEEPMNQVWSCSHYFVKFRDPDDDLDHGNLDYLECNHCSRSIKPMPRRKESLRRRSKGGVVVKEEDQAWDCEQCRLIVCVDCRTSKYQGARTQSQI